MTTQPNQPEPMNKPDLTARLLADLPRVLSLLEDMASDEPAFPQSHQDDASDAADTLRDLLAIAEGKATSKPTPMTRTAPEQAAIDAALTRLAAYGDGFPSDALLTAREAAPLCGKVRGWSDCFVLARVEPLVDWFATLDRETAYGLVEDEVLMGWFAGDDDEVDGDGDFMSTPSVYGRDSEDDDDIPDALRHCSRDGFLCIE